MHTDSTYKNPFEIIVKRVLLAAVWVSWRRVSASTFEQMLMHMRRRMLNDYSEYYRPACSRRMHLKTETSATPVPQSARRQPPLVTSFSLSFSLRPSLFLPVSLLTFSLSSLSRSFFCPLQILSYSILLTFRFSLCLCRAFYPATFSNFLRFSRFRRSSSCDRLRIPAPHCPS